MSDKTISYLEKMVGANHPTLSDTLNRLTLVGHNTNGSHKGYVEASQEGNIDATIAANPTSHIVVSDAQTISAGTLSNPVTILPGGSLSCLIGTVNITGIFKADRHYCLNGTFTFGDGAVDCVYPEWFKANTTPGTTDMTTALQAALNTKQLVCLSSTKYAYTSLIIPIASIGIKGVGYDSSASKPSSKLKHIAGAGSITWDGTNRVTNAIFKDFYIEGSGDAAETYGLDLSGFSYCRFDNIYVRLFQLDGIYVDGVIGTPNKQFSNNNFVNCRFNNNERDGLRLDSSTPANNENSANTFIGCEFSQNGAIGVNELYAEVNSYINCTSQANTTQDVYFNGRSSSFTGYTESAARRTVVLGTASERNFINTRSSFPMFDTYVDSGKNNTITVNSSDVAGANLYTDPYFIRATGTLPENITLNGSSSTFTSVSDASSPFDQSLAFTLSSELFAGFFITLDATRDAMINRWVTVFIEMDTSSLTATLAPSIYTMIDSTGNRTTGQFVSETTESWTSTTTGGVYKVMAYDIKFGSTAGSTPKIAIIPSYGVNQTGNVIRIRAIHVQMGQTRQRIPVMGWQSKPIGMAQTVITAKANLINTFRKLAGKLIYNSTNGKTYFAIGTTDVSVWRATDGSGDLTPV